MLRAERRLLSAVCCRLAVGCWRLAAWQAHAGLLLTLPATLRHAGRKYHGGGRAWQGRAEDGEARRGMSAHSTRANIAWRAGSPRLVWAARQQQQQQQPACLRASRRRPRCSSFVFLLRVCTPWPAVAPPVKRVLRCMTLWASGSAACVHDTGITGTHYLGTHSHRHTLLAAPDSARGAAHAPGRRTFECSRSHVATFARLVVQYQPVVIHAPDSHLCRQRPRELACVRACGSWKIRRCGCRAGAAG